MFKRADLRLLRTSGVRIALQSSALSAVGALIVFMLIFHAAKTTVQADIDATVSSEQADVISNAQGATTIAQSIQDALKKSGGTFYALTGKHGELLVGNLYMSPITAKSWHGWHTFSKTDRDIDLPPHLTEIRGLATTLGNGDILYVAENASAMHALNDLIRRAFLGVFGTILALGIVGALLAARETLRRVELIASTIREIMSGDLSRRVPASSAEDEFERLTSGLNAMLDRIQMLMENVRQISNDISHDLISPLGRLREHLELARRTVPTSDLRAVFDEAIFQTDSALSIFTALLRVAQIEAGARKSAFTTVDLSTLLFDIIETFDAVAEDEGKSISSEIVPNLKVFGDAELLTQVFINIIENAFRHCPMGTYVFLKAEGTKHGLIDVIISDNGPGIPAHERSRVLQRFVRLDASRHSPGTGLGLAMVAAIVDLHGGAVSLEDNCPGLKFITSLPA